MNNSAEHIPYFYGHFTFIIHIILVLYIKCNPISRDHSSSHPITADKGQNYMSEKLTVPQLFSFQFQK